MLGNIDFSMAYSIKITLWMCGLFLILLMVVARIGVLKGRNALQFLITFILITLIWSFSLIKFLDQSISANDLNIEFIWASIFIYCAAMLAYLEAWALLSRGYTLGLLLTFNKAKDPLSSEKLAKSYRGGEGLDWLIKHRFSGLIAARVIKVENNKVILTVKGAIIAFLYKLLINFFGLRNTG